MLASIIINVLLAIAVVTLFFRQKTIKEKAMQDIFALFLAGAYENRMQWFNTMNRHSHKGGHVFIGDSLIQEYQLNELFPMCPVHNRGIGGDTTTGLMKRLKESVFDLDPTHVFILIGTNDFGIHQSPPETVAENIKMIITDIKAKCPNTVCHLLSLLPVSEGSAPHIDKNSVGTRSNAMIRVTNEMLATYADGKTVIYHDVHTLLIDQDGNLKDEYTREGLHLTPLAYETLTTYFEPIITKS